MEANHGAFARRIAEGGIANGVQGMGPGAFGAAVSESIAEFVFSPAEQQQMRMDIERGLKTEADYHHRLDVAMNTARVTTVLAATLAGMQDPDQIYQALASCNTSLEHNFSGDHSKEETKKNGKGTDEEKEDEDSPPYLTLVGKISLKLKDREGKAPQIDPKAVATYDGDLKCLTPRSFDTVCEYRKTIAFNYEQAAYAKYDRDHGFVSDTDTELSFEPIEEAQRAYARKQSEMASVIEKKLKSGAKLSSYERQVRTDHRRECQRFGWQVAGKVGAVVLGVASCGQPVPLWGAAALGAGSGALDYSASKNYELTVSDAPGFIFSATMSSAFSAFFNKFGGCGNVGTTVNEQVALKTSAPATQNAVDKAVLSNITATSEAAVTQNVVVKANTESLIQSKPVNPLELQQWIDKVTGVTNQSILSIDRSALEQYYNSIFSAKAVVNANVKTQLQQLIDKSTGVANQSILSIDRSVLEQCYNSIFSENAVVNANVNMVPALKAAATQNAVGSASANVKHEIMEQLLNPQFYEKWLEKIMSGVLKKVFCHGIDYRNYNNNPKFDDE